jgi:hypothetical protein
MKTCFKCSQEKPIEDFYRHPMMADGRLGKCKDCTKKDMRDHRRHNPITVRITDKLKYRKRRAAHLARAKEYSATHREAVRMASVRSRQRHPERKKASEMVGNAVRDGRIRKPETCDFCHNATEVAAHHWDYGQPFVVSWLCGRCHRIADHARREAEARLMRQEKAS